MAALNINLGQVVNSLRSNNINIPGGDISTGSKNFSLIGTGGFKSVDEIKNTIIFSGMNQIIKLRDIADVSIRDGDIFWKAEFNQTKCIYITAKLKKGFNILKVNEDIQGLYKKNQSSLPPNISLDMAFEQAPGVKARINEFCIIGYRIGTLGR